MDLVKQPLGKVGNLVINESAGKVVLELSASELGGGVSEDLKIELGLPELVLALAASASNPALKAVLQAAGAIIAGLPA